MKDTFSKMHPVVNFIFFAFAIGFSMFLMNPVCLAISFLCALSNAVYINGKKAIKLCLAYVLPMIILIIIINPVFNHEGATMLMYLPSGNPLTLESIIYGIAAAMLMATVIFWFSSFNAVMTSDKFVYLFGRIIPSLSLVLSMALRFVPKFSAQFKTVRNAQKCIGRDISDGSLFSRIKHMVKIISIMITWSMENAIETADSMKSRGHGLKGRTSFSIYHFEKRDLIFIAVTLLAGILVILAMLTGTLNFNYFPYISGDIFNLFAVFNYFTYAMLLLLPLIINVWEGVKWKRLKSAI